MVILKNRRSLLEKEDEIRVLLNDAKQKLELAGKLLYSKRGDGSPAKVRYISQVLGSLDKADRMLANTLFDYKNLLGN